MRRELDRSTRRFHDDRAALVRVETMPRDSRGSSECPRRLTFAITIGILYGQSGARGIVRTRALSFALYLAGPRLRGRRPPAGAARSDARRRLASGADAVRRGSLLAGVAVARSPRSPRCSTSPRRAAPLVARGAGRGAGAGHLGAGLVRGPRDRRPVAGRDVVYGPLSAPIVVLIWLYALAIAVLVGAGLNAATRVLWPVSVRLAPTRGWSNGLVPRWRGGGRTVRARAIPCSTISSPRSSSIWIWRGRRSLVRSSIGGPREHRHTGVAEGGLAGLGIVRRVRYCLPCIERGSETADHPRT